MSDDGKYLVTGAYVTFLSDGSWREAYRGAVLTMTGVSGDTVERLQSMELIAPVDADLGVPQ